MTSFGEHLHSQPASSNEFKPETTAPRVAHINIDSEGDITLAVPHLVEGSTVKAIAYFRVSSHRLCAASPVFEVMLSKTSNFKEATSLANSTSKSEPTEIQLLDDNPKALAIILRAIHLQIDWLPDSLTTEQLYEVAVICDKYDIQHSLEYCLRKWIPKREFEAPTYPYKWLFISMAFARKQIFSDISRKIVLSYATPEGLAEETVFGPHIPQYYIDEIFKRRETAIQSILVRVNSLLYEYGAPITPIPFVVGTNDQLKCQSTSHQSELCDSFMLGHLIRELKRIGTYPAPAAFKGISVNHIRTLLCSLKFPDKIFLQNSPVCCKKLSSSTAVTTKRCPSCNETQNTLPPPNHADCAPNKRLIADVDHIILNVQGLDYCVNVKSAGRGATKEICPPAAGADLWHCIKYK
ncbi:hypothetical protein BDZ91DRAFT_848049 [Kalaharituber pfeilii]|nr:hypothetical protein BDZ91DRAFT_848049 [Kalaharituber pfeilii]